MWVKEMLNAHKAASLKQNCHLLCMFDFSKKMLSPLQKQWCLVLSVSCLFYSCTFAFINTRYALVFELQSLEYAHHLEPAETQWEDLLDSSTDLNLLECPYPGCGHSFKYKCNLNVHQRKKHGGIYGSDQLTTFFCRAPNCGRSFYSRGALAKHSRYIHHTSDYNLCS